MKTTAQFTFSKIKHDQDNDLHLVVTLTAPQVDWQKKRPPVCITLVPDISGSMSGEKLEYAKRSMLKLVDNLQPGDYCGLVAFESAVHPVYKPVEMTQAKKDELKAKIGALHTIGGTNFSGGMLQALEWANGMDLPSGVVNRIVMFTDGCANEGVARTRPELVQLLTANLGKATLSAFGYGRDADQELLADVAKAGKGNYAFIKNPDDALSAFAKELGGLLSTYAQNVELVVAPQNGHSVLEVVSDVDVTDDAGKAIVKIPDIMGEEVRHLVLHVRLLKQSQALPRDMSVADLSLSYDLLSDTGVKTRKQEQLKAKIRFVKPGDEQTKPTPEVDAIVALAQMVKAQVEAEKRAGIGDYSGAEAYMNAFSADLLARGHSTLSATSSKIGGKMASHSLYAANGGYLNSAKMGFTRSYGTSGMDDEAAADLALNGVSLSNSSQTAYEQSFLQPNPGAAPVPGGAVNVPAIPSGLDASGAGIPGLSGGHVPFDPTAGGAIWLVQQTFHGHGVCSCPACIPGKPAGPVGPAVQAAAPAAHSKPAKKSLDKKRSKRW